jgi:hypothetical protein
MEFIDDSGGWGAGRSTPASSAASRSSRSTTRRRRRSALLQPRSENYFRAAEWVKRGGALPKELTEIVREACAATYFFDKGKFRVVEKAQMKKL